MFNRDFHPGALMIGPCLFLVIAFVSGSAYAKYTCVDINGVQSYAPLTIKGGTICFVRERVLDPETGGSINAEAISLYFIANGNVPSRSEGRGLLYDDTPGEIVDTFSLSVGSRHREMVFVIHSMEVRYSLAEPNSSGKFFSVNVFDPTGNALHQDERASDWFGGNYSFISDGVRVIYKFPYQSRKDVEQAMYSPFALLMRESGSISVRVKFKGYLFGLPNIREKTGKYLIAGDRATVEEVSAGWCRVNYSGSVKSIEMWIMCNALEPIYFPY